MATAASRQMVLLGASEGIPALAQAGRKSYERKLITGMAIAFLTRGIPPDSITDSYKFTGEPIYSCWIDVDFEFRLIRNALRTGRDLQSYADESYTRLKDTLAFIQADARLAFLIAEVWDFRSPPRYEAATHILIENFGRAAVQPILAKLNDPNSIPRDSGPPYSKSHTRYSVALELLKCIPDSTSLPILDKLSLSPVRFVSEEAVKTSKWVRSGMPFPYGHRFLMLTTD